MEVKIKLTTDARDEGQAPSPFPNIITHEIIVKLTSMI